MIAGATEPSPAQRGRVGWGYRDEMPVANERARDLRRNMTVAERRLWRHLRMRQVDGYRFRRQRPIGAYIVDFVCLDRMLIIEVDGGQHGDRLGADQYRTRYLGESGYHVLRFWNHDVLANLDGVLETIRGFLAGPPPSRPSPARRGKG